MANNISFKISALDDFSSTMNKFEGKLEKVADKAGGIGRALAGIGAAGTLAMGAIMKKGIDYNAMLERSNIAWGTLLGSQEEALKFQSKLVDMGKESPFNYESFDKAAKLLTAMGVESDKVMPMMTNIGDAVASVGGTSETLERVGLAFAQMSAKGKVSAEEMNQLAENGIPAWQLLSDQTGIAVQDLMKMGEDGKLFAKDALPAIMKGLEETFGGGMEKATASFSGQMEKMKESANITLGKLSAPLFDMLKEVLPVINAGLEKLTSWFQALPGPTQKLISFGLILAPILTILAGGFLMLVAAIPFLISGFGALTTTVLPFIASILPMVGIVTGIIAAIIGLGVAFVTAYQKVDWFREMVDAAWAWIKNAFSTALDFISGIVKTIMSEVGSFIGEQLAKYKALWTEHGDAIKTFVKNAFTGIQVTISIVMAAIKAIFQSVWPIISNVVKIAWGVIKTVVGSGVDIIVGLIDAAMSLLKGDWEGAWDAIKGISENIWNNIEDFFSSIDLVQIGKDIIGGLIRGIGSMGGAVMRSVSKIANSIPSGVKKLLGIHSPSRVLMELGGYTAEGLAVGIGKGINGIKNMAGAMANAATPSMGGQSLNYGLAGGGGSSASAGSSGTTNYNYERMFEGAVFNVRKDEDIKRIADELYRMQQSAKARRGIK
jgi:tape measure domain-containing protein